MLLALLVIGGHDDRPDVELLEQLVRAADVVLVVVCDDHHVDAADARKGKALREGLALLVYSSARMVAEVGPALMYEPS